MKTLRWVLILFIPLNLLILLISFAFPGRLGCIDKYQVAVQKLVIHQMDKTRSLNIFQRKQAENYSANAIQYTELTPYLAALQPGSLFFSEHGRSVSRVFIHSEWKHCGIFLGSLSQIEHYWGKDHELVSCLRPFYTSENESLIFDSSYEQGVSIHSIREMAGLDAIPTLRKLLLFECNLDKDAWSEALVNSMAHLGKAYDYCFVLDNQDALYCSEFLREVVPLEKCYFEPSAKIAGRPLLLPSDLADKMLQDGISSGTFIYKGCISKNGGTTVIQTVRQNVPGKLQQDPARISE